MSQTAVKAGGGLSDSVSAGRRLRSLVQALGMLAVLILIYTGGFIFVPNFSSWFNQTALMLQVTTIGIVACTMLFCLAAGDFDLSVGSVVAMAEVVAAIVTHKTGSFAVGIAAALAAGGIVGLVNGVVIAKLRINALITTLATMQIVRGVGLVFCGGESVGISDEHFLAIGSTQILGIVLPVWIMAGFFIVFGVLLNSTVFGRNTLAVGGNYEAARLAGIRASNLKVLIFTLQGIVAAFAGIVTASRNTSGQPTDTVGLELQVISACVLGGVSLTGGIGSMFGVVVGVFIMGSVGKIMGLMNIPPFWQLIVNGAILLAAVLIDKLQQRSGK